LVIRRVALGIQDEPLEWRVSILNTNSHEYFSELVV
jgi:GntR family transcriptional regulator